MQTVNDYMRVLARGPLKNLSLASDNDIIEAERDTVINYLNDALNRIYTEVHLREQEVLLLQARHITHYHLDSRYSRTNPNRPEGNVPYIMDLPAEPFLDDVAKIISAADESSCAIPLNDPDNPKSYHTPNPATLQIPCPQHDRPISVRYRALHPRLEAGIYNAEILLPRPFEEVLKHIVASLAHSDVATIEANQKAVSHQNMADILMARLAINNGNQGVEDQPTGTKFLRRGYP